ncbi:MULTISPECIES: DUF3870 domain-containing protein [Fusobacterium]|uniref:DUF3870 domain-containing protein n=1 Tax=Fusobacterium TaxID=848 RepID=UPI0010324977|nr:DUF3870 domain-containing protein [Fusobacterium ulcerans]
MINNNCIYILGVSKTNFDNAITKNYNMLFVGFLLDKNTNEIVDVEVTMILELSNRFIKSLLIGKNFIKDQDVIIKEFENKYFGRSQKALIIAYKDALKKYENIH